LDRFEFKHYRQKLKKTQQQVADLLGKSVKAIHSYEQGWRLIPADVQRQILFLISKAANSKKVKQCWTIMRCPADRKKNCPAWEYKTGQMCWFINGTICAGQPQKNWNEKMKICRSCNVFLDLMGRVERIGIE